MTLITYKIIAAIIIGITSIITVAYPIAVRAYPKHRPFLELADAFASGIFLGAALFHMLPEARHDLLLSVGAHDYPLAELLCAGGFLLLLLLERIANIHHAAKQSTQIIPYMFALILIIHALIEGAAVGVNTTFAGAFVIFIAIVAHKSSESFALAVILNQHNLRLARIITIIIVFSLMTPLGIILGTQLTSTLPEKSSLLLTGSFNAFAAGTFLYMSTLHHMNHHKKQHEGEGLIEFGALFVGLIVMAVAAAVI